jgi:6-pyruvoyltetrahydropterin/6-carboxytetrahydropterin synthase
MITCTRYHDFSAGHRVYKHEGKCKYLHGHNYRVHFTLAAPQLDFCGRVLDFSFIKIILCEWLEENWDHKFLIWEDDPWSKELMSFDGSIVIVPFNPTAENMALYLLNIKGPELLSRTDATLINVTVEETRKCYATARLP